MSDTLTTERLLLRTVTPEVYQEVFTNYSIEEAMAFFGCANKTELLQEQQKYEGGLTTYRISFLAFIIVEKSSGRAIGKCGYHVWQKEHARAEVGYGLFAERDKNKGYMKEALGRVLRFGFNDMQLNRIEAFVSPGNEPSLKLVKGFGFTEEGLLREHYCKNGQPEDSLVFSLLKREYGII